MFLHFGGKCGITSSSLPSHLPESTGLPRGTGKQGLLLLCVPDTACPVREGRCTPGCMPEAHLQ